MAMPGHGTSFMDDIEMASVDSENIWNEAMALLLRLQAEPESEALREAVRRFCAQDVEHRIAWDEARRVYRLTGAAVGAKDRVPAKSAGVNRRKIITGLGAVAVGSALWKGPDLWRRWHSDAVTSIAEIREMQLPDGSGLMLGPDSKLEIAFTPSVRKVVLLEGMAFCNIANDSDRPFQVRAGELLGTAESAVFEVRQNGGRCLIGVERGHVRVTVEDSVKGRASNDIVLRNDDWFAFGPAAGQIERGKRNPGQTAAWRDKLLVADREQIRSVVAEIGRWKKGRIIIPQPSLAAARVSGLYDLADPDAALAAVIGPYGGRVVHLSPWLTVLASI